MNYLIRVKNVSMDEPAEIRRDNIMLNPRKYLITIIKYSKRPNSKRSDFGAFIYRSVSEYVGFQTLSEI